jgi:hypothetical protein
MGQEVKQIHLLPEHFYLAKPSITHQSSETPHLDRVGNPRAKSNLVTPTSLDTLNNT